MKHEEFLALVRSAIDKLYEQNARSYEPEKGCMYLSSTGQCCIVGFMMPDDETRRLADSFDTVGTVGITSLRYSDEINFPWAQQFIGEQIQLLAQLQQEHDAGAIVGMRNVIVPRMRKIVDSYDERMKLERRHHGYD